ncbi:MAG: hypothetical protein ABJF01_17555 [bacterium]
MYVRRGLALGSVDDPQADDFDDSSSDPRSEYVTWAAAVKQYGGYVTTAPHTTTEITKGTAAAAYPVSIIAPAPNYMLNAIFHRWPDDWSSDGKTGYFKAPAAVLAYTETGYRTSAGSAITQAQSAPGEPSPKYPDWYTQIKDLLKSGGWILGGLVVLSAISYLPRRRD